MRKMRMVIARAKETQKEPNVSSPASRFIAILVRFERLTIPPSAVETHVVEVEFRESSD